MKLTKSDWILVILKKKPLDRIHIMKTLFLIWHRSKRKIRGYFCFEPYLYGPYSLEVYSELRSLLADGLAIQPPHPVQEWTNYYLTGKGRMRANKVIEKFDPKIVSFIENIVEEISHLTFFELLQKVYSEAPDFAANSVLREVIQP